MARVVFDGLAGSGQSWKRAWMRSWAVVGTLVLIWSLSACGPGQTPTASPTKPAAVLPSPIPTATLTTALPTPSPVPTATPTAVPPTPAPLRFDPDMAYQQILVQCGFGPRSTGSINNELLGEYLLSTLQGYGWTTDIQDSTYRDVLVRNIEARRGQGPVVILGAHYDTRPYADHDPPETQNQHILGANDGGSGVAVLLELARVLDIDRVPYEVRLVFFDAEDRGNLDGWPFSVGAEAYAEALDVAPEYVIVVDMVGDEHQALYWEGNSDPELNARIWGLAAKLGYLDVFVPEQRWQITDDHLPFVRRGWPAVDIIDFEYPYWHTTQDTADKVRAESLGRIGHVLEVFLEESLE
jgi:glutaminyl-peptide cyclotransferase